MRALYLDHRPVKVLITGASGTGKTTLLSELINLGESYWRTIVVYDWQGELQKTIRNYKLVEKLSDICEPGIWICDPAVWKHTLPLDKGFNYTCRVLLEFGRRGLIHIPTLFACDEIQTFGLKTFTNEFRDLMQVGRRYGIDVAVIAQQINELDNRFRNQFTHIYTFRHVDPYVLEQMRKWGFDPEKVKSLGVGQYQVLNTYYQEIIDGQTVKSKLR